MENLGHNSEGILSVDVKKQNKKTVERNHVYSRLPSFI